MPTFTDDFNRANGPIDSIWIDNEPNGPGTDFGIGLSAGTKILSVDFANPAGFALWPTDLAIPQFSELGVFSVNGGTWTLLVGVLAGSTTSDFTGFKFFSTASNPITFNILQFNHQAYNSGTGLPLDNFGGAFSGSFTASGLVRLALGSNQKLTLTNAGGTLITTATGTLATVGTRIGLGSGSAGNAWAFTPWNGGDNIGPDTTLRLQNFRLLPC